MHREYQPSWGCMQSRCAALPRAPCERACVRRGRAHPHKAAVVPPVLRGGQAGARRRRGQRLAQPLHGLGSGRAGARGARRPCRARVRQGPPASSPAPAAPPAGAPCSGAPRARAAPDPDPRPDTAPPGPAPAPASDSRALRRRATKEPLLWLATAPARGAGVSPGAAGCLGVSGGRPGAAASGSGRRASSSAPVSQASGLTGTPSARARASSGCRSAAALSGAARSTMITSAGGQAAAKGRPGARCASGSSAATTAPATDRDTPLRACCALPGHDARACARGDQAVHVY